VGPHDDSNTGVVVSGVRRPKKEVRILLRNVDTRRTTSPRSSEGRMGQRVCVQIWCALILGLDPGSGGLSVGRPQYDHHLENGASKPPTNAIRVVRDEGRLQHKFELTQV
jgi:hypothetical protein